MIFLKQQCVELMQRDPDNHFGVDFSKVESLFIGTITSLNEDVNQVLVFGYELRKQDLSDEHSYEFLSGLVKPPILVDIILSNYWDDGEKKMKCDFKKKYKLVIGDNNPLVYLKNHFKNFNEKPVIKKEGLDWKQYTDEVHLLLAPNGGL